MKYLILFLTITLSQKKIGFLQVPRKKTGNFCSHLLFKCQYVSGYITNILLCLKKFGSINFHLNIEYGEAYVFSNCLRLFPLNFMLFNKNDFLLLFSIQNWSNSIIRILIDTGYYT